MSISLAWVGDGAPRMEVAQVEQTEAEFVASGTQLGVIYELRYRLEAGMLSLDLVGQRTLELQLDSADFFDLGGSPLFNSLPVLRDRLLEPGPPRDYLMRLVDVPSSRSRCQSSATNLWATVSFASAQASSSATSRSTHTGSL